MKCLLLSVSMFYATVLCMGQSVETSIYSVENSIVMVKNEFVSKMDYTNYSGIKPFTNISSVSFQSLDNQSNYHASFYRYNGWDGESGDFQSVDIKRNGRSIFQLDNQDGWVLSFTRTITGLLSSLREVAIDASSRETSFVLT